MITKPAGVALQIIGAVLLFGSVLVMVNASGIGGAVMLGVAIWLLVIGRRPATRDRATSR